ncbi:hypothetical protein BY458DRAFT_475186 [Sporodiniella umbellata]|nr:hypothetical protein BY458DRAFT_475186 [Sporodiniella umbellata]
MSQGLTNTQTNTLQDYNNLSNLFPFFTEEKRRAVEPCNHCQKARLTCDGGRPCQGCIKRDLSTTCSDMNRKKSKSHPAEQMLHPNVLSFASSDTPSSDGPLNQFMNHCSLFNFPLGDLGFGSETAGLEYNVLGNMAEKQELFPFSPIFSSPVTPGSTHSQPQSSPKPKRETKQRKMRPTENVYMSVQKPFNYAEGFHYLIAYVTEKMSKEDLKRISRALSLFRPSFLSLIMNLTEEDLVFMEKCIQRTLLEYEKLISFSGTPTVVWRRTGEVCLVGKEFSLLTQWTKEMLLSKKTYIYELMENQSAVEYWEKFSSHAFDNTDKACSYSCILRTPQRKPVPCTFCFTIKRDIFDLPSVIVGNFLPILS